MVIILGIMVEGYLDTHRLHVQLKIVSPALVEVDITSLGHLKQGEDRVEDHASLFPNRIIMLSIVLIGQ